jgi:hypothetical protein
MKQIRLVPIIAVAILASVSLAKAQNSGSQPQAKPEAMPAAPAAAPAPSPDQAAAQAAAKLAADKAAAEMAAAQAARDAEAAKTQPLMAEGLDLKGEPRRFAPRNTVE